MPRRTEQEDSLYQDALTALETGNCLVAEILLKQIPKHNDSYFLAISMLATIAYEGGHNKRAIAYLDEAATLAPSGDSAALIGLATMYKAEGDAEKSRGVLAQICREFPDDNSAASMYAEALSENKEYALSKTIIERLLSLFPGHASVLLAMGDILEKLGDLDAAIIYYKMAIDADAYCVSAYTKIVAFNAWEEGIFDTSVLESLTDSCALPPQEVALIHNSLGTIYEKAGDYDAAMSHYGSCNEILRRAIPEHLITAPWTIDQLRNTYTPDIFEDANTDKQSPLVFVFGMPRSGSTLIEQILINSPDVDTLGEFRGIGAEIESLGNRIGNDLTQDTFPDDCSVLGDEYLANRIGDIDSRFIIDKMPSNHNYIGLLYLLFPNAKFIYTQRDPAAVCFSNWTTIYREGHKYSYTLREMVEQYKFHEEVMALWMDVLPAAIHTVRYEDVVNDFDSTVGSLCDFLGVDFVDPMREFHKMKRKVDTASVGQVTKPLYTKSLDRVGRFGDRLGELTELLKCPA